MLAFVATFLARFAPSFFSEDTFTEKIPGYDITMYGLTRVHTFADDLIAAKLNNLVSRDVDAITYAINNLTTENVLHHAHLHSVRRSLVRSRTLVVVLFIILLITFTFLYFARSFHIL
jgi:hypothetical protein